VYPSTDPPAVCRATVLRADGERLLLVTREDKGPLPDGATVLLDAQPSALGPHFVLRLHADASGRLRGTVERAIPVEQRAFPRCSGALHVGYRVRRDALPEVAIAWLLRAEAAGPEHRPEPFMNFSVSGLAFEDAPRAEPGDLLLLRFCVPREDVWYRATARVLRVHPVPVDERDESSVATHRVAVAFEVLAPEGAEALAAYTLRIQGAQLEGIS
jgi:hypothetical protein